jgi:hypothetical protein
MMEALEFGHSHESGIKFGLTNDSCTPANNMLLEDPLVQLVENVRSDASEDVRIWEICPEQMMDSVKTKIIKKVWVLAILMTPKSCFDLGGIA